MTERPPQWPFLGQGGEAARLVAELDWSATPIGPIAAWPQSLRTAVGICLASRYPMVIWWGPELVLLYNDAWVPILGPHKHPALGRPGAQVWPEMWHIIGAQLTGVLASGTATWSDDQLLPAHRHGYLEEAYFTYSYSPITDEDGAVAGVFTAVTETTGRVLAERRLRLLGELGEISAVTAPTVDEACAAACEVLAGGRADVPFGSVYLRDGDGAVRRAAFFGTLDDPRVMPGRVARADTPDQPVWQVLDTGGPQVLHGLTAYRGMFVEHDGPMGPADPDVAVVLPLGTSGDGEPVGVLCAGASPFRALDPDYHRFLELVAGQVGAAIADAQAYQAERRRAHELAELDRVKTEFFTGVSHELRTPLTLIAGPVQDGLDDERDPLSPAQRERLELVRRNTARLRRLVDTLLEFSRVQDGRSVAERVPVDLAVLTRGVAESFGPAVERAGLGFTVDCAELPSAVSVDPDMWERLVLNLLSNAVKFTPAGAVAVRQTSAPDGGVALEVTDTGIGITADELPLLFRRFHRARGAHGRSHEGSGIGLALVAELAQLHGGRATVRSVPGRGSTFRVTLPASAMVVGEGMRRPASALAGSYLDEAVGWSDADETQVLGPAGAESTVLVVEDNADLRRFVAGLLAPHHTVLVAADGVTALARAREARPDLVLTDVMMPGLDGFELLAALRADPATAATPVILLSARAGEEATRDGLAAGADDYLVKPFSSHDLLARIRSVITLARVRSREGQWRAALLDSMQDGFFVIDPDGAVIEVNAAFETVLGYGADGLPYPAPHPWWPDAEEEPDAVAKIVRDMAAAQRSGGRYVIPLRHRDGRRLWCECQASLAPGRDGNRPSLVGTVRDVTERRRTERLTALSAEVGGLQTRPGPLLERLTAALRVATPLLADIGTVSLRRPSGWLDAVAVAGPGPQTEELVRGIAAHEIPAELAASYQAGRPFVVDGPSDELLRRAAHDAEDLATLRSVDARTVLVVPLVLGGRLLGSASFLSVGRARHHDADDLDLAAELGRHVAIMVESERVSTREHQLHRMTTALAAAGSVQDAARVLVDGVIEVFDAAGAEVFVERSGRGLESVYRSRDHAGERSGAETPVGECALSGVPLWVHDRDEHRRRHPEVPMADAAAAVVPLLAGRRVVGVLSAGFATRREFDVDERRLLETVAAQVASAFERAALADVRREVAETLQHSLLPPALPAVDRLALAARYLPATWGARTGGDWYDVLPLDAHRMAIVVGDVVGQGAAAAAVMGQLRSALAAHLLDGHAPAAALTRLNRFAVRITGAMASTALCLVLDTRDGGVRWARAGHPPPLVLGPAGARSLEGAAGMVLGVFAEAPYGEGSATVAAGESILLYTDGLVERRDEVIDDGLARLSAVGAEMHGAAPAELIDVLLGRCLDEAGPADDVAVLVARLLPDPLHLRHPARPDRLRVVREELSRWAAAAALPASQVADLQLAVGEAVANSVEHAYGGGASAGGGDAGGGFTVAVTVDDRGDVHAEVCDEGRWRTDADRDRNRRAGHGMDVLAALGRDLVVDTTGPGSRVTFVVPAPAPAGARPPVLRSSGPLSLPVGADEELQVQEVPQPDGSVRLSLHGDLDLATAPLLEDAVRPRLAGAVGPPVVVDLTGVRYLSSAGVGLLTDLRRAAADRLRIVSHGGSPAARVLALSGLDHVSDPTGDGRFHGHDAAIRRCRVPGAAPRPRP